MDLSGRKAFVTGTTRGIGQAIACELRAKGAFVIGTGTRPNESAAAEVDQYFTFDFSSEDQIEACARKVAELEPDILINNAGINKIAPFAEINPDDFKLIQQINVYAPFRLCQMAIPAMSRRKWGRIVNISSIWGLVGKEYRASYATSKFAIDGMTLALATEHAGNNILANCVAPGFVDTELTRRVLGEDGIKELVAKVPARRMAETDEISKYVVWLASEENSYISGVNSPIDGGFSRA